MKQNTADDIIESLSDGRTMPTRKAVAEAVTSPEGEVNQEVYETAQETYIVETSTWDEDGESHKVTSIRNQGDEAYVLEETNDGEDYKGEISVSSGVYSESIHSKESFNDLLESLENNEAIGYEKDLEDYSVEGGVGKNSRQ